MKLELSITELKDITKALREDLSKKNKDASSVNMCLNQKFETERVSLIDRFNKVLVKEELEYCEKNLAKVTFKDLYDITWQHSREGKMGTVRFPKRIRDLYRKLFFDVQSSEQEVKSKLISIMNKRCLRYSDVIICTHDVLQKGDEHED